MTLMQCISLLAVMTLSTGALAQTCPAGNPRVAPDSRYNITAPVAGEEVVTDLATGLMWKRCSEGQSGAACGTGRATTHNWSQALTLANDAAHAGFSDWRLPNREELRSLVETGCFSPSINTVAFPATASTFYWSSTTFPVDFTSYAYFVFFEGGVLTALIPGARKDDFLQVRLVRDGQPLAVGLDEPGLTRFALPAPNPPNANCPSGYFTAIVDDGPGTGLTAGAFGMEVLLDDPGTRVLAGGLNFGGLIDIGQVGFAAFNIANAANEPQRLNLSLTGSPSTSSTAGLPVRISIVRRTATSSDTVFETTQTISLASPYVSSIDLPPGFYAGTVAPTSGAAGGTPEGQFFFSLTTSFVNRPGGGFQGGAVVGGYHATHPFGGVSGFAGFCLATPHTTSIRVLSQPSYGPSGAKDLRLRIQDAQQREVVVVPAG